MGRVAVSLRMTYAEYIVSDAWHARRRQVLKRDRHRCRGCGESADLHVHHRTYERFGAEELADLVTVCQLCHSFIHQERARTRRPLDETTDKVLRRMAASGRVERRPPQGAAETSARQKAAQRDARRRAKLIRAGHRIPHTAESRKIANPLR